MTHPLRWLALIALDRSELPTAGDATKRFAELFPAAPQPEIVQSTEALLTITVDGFTAAAALAPRPIPWSQLEGPCATAWYWPEATETLRSHTQHLMLTLIDEGGSPIVKSSHLTRLAAAIADCASSVAVFWGPSCLVHPPAAFIEQATQMTDDDLPLFIWVDFRVEQRIADGQLLKDGQPGEGDRSNDGGVRLYTTGLAALGRAEIEVDQFHGPPQELLEHVYNVAHYELAQNKEIGDGDTIGLTDQLQVTACRRPSMFDANLEVVGLQFTPSEP